MALYSATKTKTQNGGLYSSRIKSMSEPIKTDARAVKAKKDEKAKAEQTQKNVHEYIFEQGLKKLDDKYKDKNIVARAYSPEYQTDVTSLARSVGYDTAPKERNKAFNPEATKKVLPYLGEKAKMGLIDFAAGVSNLVDVGKTHEGQKTLSSNQRTQFMIDRDKAEFAQAEERNVSPGMKKVGDVAGATVAMIPSLMLSAVNPTAGLTLMGTSAAGSSAQEAMKENATKGQALAYGGLSGAIEVGTEKLFGGLPFMKGIGDKAASKLISPIKNKLIKAGVKYTMNMAEEALEEGIAGALNPVAKRLTYNKNAKAPAIADIGEQMFMGAAVAGILGIPGTVADTVGKQVPTIQDIKSVNNDIITFNMADGSTLELNPSQMEYTDLKTIKEAIPDKAKGKTKEAIETIDKGMAKAVKRNEVIAAATGQTAQETSGLYSAKVKQPAEAKTEAGQVNTPVKAETVQEGVQEVKQLINVSSASDRQDVRKAINDYKKSQKPVTEMTDEEFEQYNKNLSRVEVPTKLIQLENDVDLGTATEYANMLKDSEMPSIKVYRSSVTKDSIDNPMNIVDGAGNINARKIFSKEDIGKEVYTVGDGNHRVIASELAGMQTVPVDFSNPKDVEIRSKAKKTVAEIEAIEKEFFGHKLLKINLQQFAEKIQSAKDKLLAEFKKEKAAIRWLAKEKQSAALDKLSQKYDAKIEKLNKLLDAEKYKNFWKSELDKKDLRDRISQLRTDKNQQIADMKKKFSEKLKETKKDYTLKKHEAIGKLKEKIRDKAAEDRAKAAEITEINKKLDKLRKLDLKHMRPEYKKKIETILSVFDITAKSHTARKMGELQKLKHYIEENPEHSIPDHILKQLDMLSKKTVSQITKEEFDGIYNAVMHLSHLEKLKNKLIMKERYRDAAEIADEASANVVNGRKLKVDPTVIDTNKPEFSRSYIKEFFHNHLNPETLSIMSDQGRNGIIKKILFDDMYEGHSAELKYRQDAYGIFEKFLEGLGDGIRGWSRSFNKGLKDSELVEIPIAKQQKQTISKIKLTKAERLYIFLASLDADAKRSMLKSGVSFGTNLSQVVKLTETDLKTIADSMTKEEKQFADLATNYFLDFARPKMNEVFLELNGYELIPHRKGYVPIKRHKDFLDRDYLKMRNKSNTVSIEGMGVLKERVKASTPIVVDDIFRVLVEHIEKVSSYYGIAKPLRNAKMLVENPKLKNSYRQVGMYNVYTQLNKYLQDIETKSADMEFVDKLGYTIQNKFASSALGLNPFTILKQFSAYALETNEISVKYLLKAQFTKSAFDEIKKYSPILSERTLGNVSLELGEIGKIARIRRLFGNYRDLPQLLTKGIVAADKQIITKTWNAVKMAIKARNPTLTENELLTRVARKTEEIIRHTNSASTLYDRSEIARSKSLFTRAATMFTSQTNIMFNASTRAVLEYNQSEKAPKDFARASKKLVTILVIANLMEQSVDQLRNKIKGKDDEEEKWNLPLDIVEGILNQVYFVGKAFSAYRSKIKFGKFVGYDLTISQFQVVNQVIDYATDLTALIEQISTKERYKSGENKGKTKWKKTLSRLTDETFSILSRLMGLPYDSVKNLIESFTNKE